MTDNSFFTLKLLKYSFLKMGSIPVTYLDIARGKQDERHQRIPKDWHLSPKDLQSEHALEVPRRCGILTERELHITEKNDAVDIVNKISDGAFTAREVCVAFCKRAAIAQQLVSTPGAP